MTSVAAPPKASHRPLPLSRQQPASGTATPTDQPQQVKSIVSLKGVCKTYKNGCKALHQVNFTVPKGEFLFVTGASGAGKSTFLKLLYGQERPSSGEVWVNDRNLSKLRGNRLALLRRQIGVVFQDYKLIPRRTVSENVSFVLWAQGYSRKEINRRLLPTLKMVGLQHKANC